MGKLDANIAIRASDKSKSAFRSVNSNMNMLKGTALKLAAVVGVSLGTRAMVTALNANSAMVGSIAKMSDKTGIATERLQAYRQAAIEGGGSVRGMDEALTKMSKRLAEAAEIGGGAANQWLKKLNLDVNELQTLSPDELFSRYSASINTLTTRGAKLAAMSALLGDESRSLINVIEGGPTAINAMEQELSDLGITITRIDAAKIEAANDAMAKSKAVAEGAATAFNVALAPVIQGIANEFLNVAKEAGGFGEIANKVVGIAVKGAIHLTNSVQGIKLAWKAVQHAIVLATTKTIDLLVDSDKALTTFVNKFTPWSKTVSTTLTDLYESLTHIARQSSEELRTEFNKPLDSAPIEAWYANVVSKSQEAAEKIAESKKDLFNPDAEQIAAENSRLEQFIEHNRIKADQYTKIWQGAFDKFTGGVGDAVADSLLQQENFGDSMQAMARNVVKQIISGLATIYVKKAALWALDKMGMAANTAASVVSGGTIATAWAPAAAAVSLASFGANALPASTGLASTFALANTLSLTGVAHDGLSSVPTDGTYLLQKGEKVVNNQDTKKLDNLMNGGSATYNMNITFNVNAIDARSGADFIKQNSGPIEAVMSNALNNVARRGL